MQKNKLNSKKKNYKKLIKELILISLGCAVYGFSFTHLIIPSKMAEGGGAGIALLLHYLFNVPASMCNLLVNIPLLIIGYKFLDKRTMLYTIYGILMISGWVGFFEVVRVPIDLGGDRFLAALFGGLMAGSGLSLTFSNGGSTGGIDILAIMMNRFYKIPIGRAIQIMDAIIIIGTLLVIKELPPILYTTIYIYVFTKVLDYILEGGLSGKAVMIISPKIEEISKEISTKMDRGMTYLKGEGSYSKKDIKIGYCAISLKEIKEIKEIIYSIDERAFVTINDVHDILGEVFSFKPKKKRI